MVHSRNSPAPETRSVLDSLTMRPRPASSLFALVGRSSHNSRNALLAGRLLSASTPAQSDSNDSGNINNNNTNSTQLTLSEYLRQSENDTNNGYDSLQDAFDLFRQTVQQERNRPAPPASISAIVNLPSTRIFPSTHSCVTKECSVCMEALVSRSSVARLPCGHLFHVTCIIGWMTKTNSCPECRYEMPTDDPIYEEERVERMKDRPIVTCDCKCNNYHTCFFDSSLQQKTVAGACQE